MPHFRGTSPSVRRVLVCLYLCGLSVTCLALPLPDSSVSHEIAKQMQLAGIMYRFGDMGQSSTSNFNRALSQSSSGQRRKRYGIAGLDNVDVITSILDQQRARKKPRMQTMSVSLTMADIRRLMEAGR